MDKRLRKNCPGASSLPRARNGLHAGPKAAGHCRADAGPCHARNPSQTPAPAADTAADYFAFKADRRLTYRGRERICVLRDACGLPENGVAQTPGQRRDHDGLRIRR